MRGISVRVVFSSMLILSTTTGCLQRLRLVTQTFLTLSPRSLTVTRTMPGKKRKSEEAEAKEVVKKPKPEKKNKSDTKWEEVEWASEAKTEEGHKWTLKLSSWNVDGESLISDQLEIHRRLCQV